jgi:hypothetical protein
MRRVTRTKNLRDGKQTTLSTGRGDEPERLKQLVRDGLIRMNGAEREHFIQALETELRHIHLSIRTYLIPLGIPARSPDELMPLEVAHLIRFLKINVPRAMPAVAQAMSRFTVLAAQEETAGDRLAA